MQKIFHNGDLFEKCDLKWLYWSKVEIKAISSFENKFVKYNYYFLRNCVFELPNGCTVSEQAENEVKMMSFGKIKLVI